MAHSELTKMARRTLWRMTVQMNSKRAHLDTMENEALSYRQSLDRLASDRQRFAAECEAKGIDVSNLGEADDPIAH